ncbi:MAG: hypothetical protein BGO01_09960 [Armatimonadetes bacterium 55-13]|nr:DUF167 domain-containing protein [Armatimonadota bacterium]OJU62725.1 MAG: hypothetical protein BGO01_09960 [Armatimonadetes bacterium 55-13]
MQPKPSRAVFRVRVQPRSSRNRIQVVSDGELKIWVTAPPVDGEANDAVCKLLAKILRVAGSAITIRTGAASKHKIIEILGLSPLQVLECVHRENRSV